MLVATLHAGGGRSGEYCQKCAVRRVGASYKASGAYDASHGVARCCRTVAYGPMCTGERRQRTILWGRGPDIGTSRLQHADSVYN